MCLNVFQRKDQSLVHASRLRLNSLWSFCARRPPLTHQEYIIYRESGNASLLVWMHVKSCVELICITHYHIQCLRGLYRCTAATVPDPARQSEGDFTPMLLRAIETKQRGSRPASKCTRKGLFVVQMWGRTDYTGIVWQYWLVTLPIQKLKCFAQSICRSGQLSRNRLSVWLFKASSMRERGRVKTEVCCARVYFLK